MKQVTTYGTYVIKAKIELDEKDLERQLKEVERKISLKIDLEKGFNEKRARVETAKNKLSSVEVRNYEELNKNLKTLNNSLSQLSKTINSSSKDEIKTLSELRNKTFKTEEVQKGVASSLIGVFKKLLVGNVLFAMTFAGLSSFKELQTLTNPLSRIIASLSGFLGTFLASLKSVGGYKAEGRIQLAELIKAFYKTLKLTLIPSTGYNKPEGFFAQETRDLYKEFFENFIQGIKQLITDSSPAFFKFGSEFLKRTYVGRIVNSISKEYQKDYEKMAKSPNRDAFDDFAAAMNYYRATNPTTTPEFMRYAKGNANLFSGSNILAFFGKGLFFPFIQSALGQGFLFFGGLTFVLDKLKNVISYLIDEFDLLNLTTKKLRESSGDTKKETENLVEVFEKVDTFDLWGLFGRNNEAALSLAQSIATLRSKFEENFSTLELYDYLVAEAARRNLSLEETVKLVNSAFEKNDRTLKDLTGKTLEELITLYVEATGVARGLVSEREKELLIANEIRKKELERRKEEMKFKTFAYERAGDAMGASAYKARTIKELEQVDKEIEKIEKYGNVLAQRGKDNKTFKATISEINKVLEDSAKLLKDASASEKDFEKQLESLGDVLSRTSMKTERYVELLKLQEKLQKKQNEIKDRLKQTPLEVMYDYERAKALDLRIDSDKLSNKLLQDRINFLKEEVANVEYSQPIREAFLKQLEYALEIERKRNAEIDEYLNRTVKIKQDFDAYVEKIKNFVEYLENVEPYEKADALINEQLTRYKNMKFYSDNQKLATLALIKKEIETFDAVMEDAKSSADMETYQRAKRFKDSFEETYKEISAKKTELETAFVAAAQKFGDKLASGIDFVNDKIDIDMRRILLSAANDFVRELIKNLLTKLAAMKFAETDFAGSLFKGIFSLFGMIFNPASYLGMATSSPLSNVSSAPLNSLNSSLNQNLSLNSSLALENALNNLNENIKNWENRVYLDATLVNRTLKITDKNELKRAI